MMVEIEVTNQCTCPDDIICRECDDITSGDDLYGATECPQCGSRDIDVREGWELCDGECYRADAAWLESELSKWTSGVDSDYVIIHGSGMGWQNRSGWRVVPLEEVGPEALSVDSEWRQIWYIEPDRLTAVQSHHDSPTGEQYEFEALTFPLAMSLVGGSVDGQCPNDECEESEDFHAINITVDGDSVTCEKCGTTMTEDDVDFHREVEYLMS